MNDIYPQRPQAHQLEEASRRYFVQCLPANWASERPDNDYGIDLRVDMFEGNAATGLELLVQLKASERAADGDTESIDLRAATYNMLWDELQVAMLVKYCRAENEAYWLLLKDARAPQDGCESVTARIPKANRLSQIDWRHIQEYVRNVTDAKLAAIRRQSLGAGAQRA
ncbi:DUF4365 domain-containing protein [Pseudoxanthomonas beigongshangi]